jgi:hypothetical protein
MSHRTEKAAEALGWDLSLPWEFDPQLHKNHPGMIVRQALVINCNENMG